MGGSDGWEDVEDWGCGGDGDGGLEEVEGVGFAERCRMLWPVLEAAEVAPPEGTKVDLADT